MLLSQNIVTVLVYWYDTYFFFIDFALYDSAVCEHIKKRITTQVIKLIDFIVTVLGYNCGLLVFEDYCTK